MKGRARERNGGYGMPAMLGKSSYLNIEEKAYLGQGKKSSKKNGINTVGRRRLLRGGKIVAEATGSYGKKNGEIPRDHRKNFAWIP